MAKIYKQLSIVGITYNKVDRGVYALILKEQDGNRRIPIVIGMAEAQSIECKLQEIITPRPLTHDLMVNMMRAFGITLKSVIIKQLDGGIFAADMMLDNGDREVTLDARSSDAISIALRMGVPLLIDEELLEQISFKKNTDEQAPSQSDKNIISQKNNSTQTTNEYKWEELETAEFHKLENLLKKFVDNEEYENAARLKKIIQRRIDINNPPQNETPDTK